MVDVTISRWSRRGFTQVTLSGARISFAMMRICVSSVSDDLRGLRLPDVANDAARVGGHLTTLLPPVAVKSKFVVVVHVVRNIETEGSCSVTLNGVHV